MKMDIRKPLTDEQREFLEGRGEWGRQRLALNAAFVGAQEPEADESPDEDPENMTDEERAATLAEAKAWISKANGPALRKKLKEYELPTDGETNALRARLTEAVEQEYAPRAPEES